MATRYRCGYLDSFTELEARSGLERNLIFRFSFQDVEQMKITLITACYNSAEMIGTTLESVLSQKGVDVEYIVVDGGWKDGTVDIINLPWNLNLKTAVGGEFFLTQRRDAPATKSSGCLSEANPKGSKGPREAEIFISRKVREVREVF